MGDSPENPHEPLATRQSETPKEPDRQKPLTEKEIVAFLVSRNIKRLRDLERGKHLLFVLPDYVRHETHPAFGSWDPEKRPCIVRVNSPVAFRIDDYDGSGYMVNGGQLDYYSIDRKGRIHWQKTTSWSNDEYDVLKDFFYEPADHLFPLKDNS